MKRRPVYRHRTPQEHNANIGAAEWLLRVAIVIAIGAIFVGYAL